MQTGVVSERAMELGMFPGFTRRRIEGGRLAVGISKEQKPRGRDTLPEYTRYRDDGCDISDHCLDCPLPRCRYEEPGGLRALLNESRDREIIQLRLKGVAVEELADRFGISRRTIFRVIGSTRIPARREYDTTPIPIRRDRTSIQPTDRDFADQEEALSA
jgi:hypothetical protein